MAVVKAKKKKIDKSNPANWRESNERLSAPDYILGLDLSLNHSGWALYDVGRKETTMGVIEPVKVIGMERIDQVLQRVLNLAQYGMLQLPKATVTTRQEGVKFEAPLSPVNCLVLIESYAFGLQGQAVTGLAELGGVIRHQLWRLKIPYLNVTPTQLKRFITSKGNAKKNEIMMESFDRFGVKINDDNICDAHGLMQIGRAICAGTWQPNKPLVSFQKDVVSDLIDLFFTGKTSDKIKRVVEGEARPAARVDDGDTLFSDES